MAEFDFEIDGTGELVMDFDNVSMINVVRSDDLRLQLAFTRIKSVSQDWYIDKVGADLEVIVGRPCTPETADAGKRLIERVLTYDELWSDKDFLVTAEIVGNTGINYTVSFKIFQGYSEEDVIIKEIYASLDLIKGVHVKYGWEPRR